MKKLLFVVVSTLFVFGLFAQNAALTLEPVSYYKKSRSEKFDMIMKEGKPFGIFDKVSGKNFTLTGEEITPNRNATKTKCSVSVQKSTKADVAIITLKVVGDPWGDGTGVQMLIDKDAEIVDNFWDWFWSSDEEFYNNSEYKIPNDATYDLDNPKVILDDEGSVEVPGGVYDFIFFRPLSFMLAILNWEGTDDYAMADDFEFIPGYEYVFTVETAGEVGFVAPIDVKLSDIILPIPSLYLTDNEEVSVVVYNNGEYIMGDMEFAYKVNGGTEEVVKYYGFQLDAGEEKTFTFSKKADFSEVGFYMVEARVLYEPDLNPYNNAISGKTKKMALIELPFTDEFDTPASMDNWSTIDGNGDGLAWLYDNWILTDADGGKGCLQVLCQSYGANEYLITDPIEIAAPGTLNMSFYSYALGNDKINILYGTTYNVEEMKLWDTVYPSNSDWEIVEMQLDIDEPGNYFFAFHYFGDKADDAKGVNLDKVNMTFTNGINESNPTKLKLYPNPVSGILFVELETNTIDKVFVYNILGENIHTNSNVNYANYNLNTTGFAPGIYFISVQTETGVIHSKFVVQ